MHHSTHHRDRRADTAVLWSGRQWAVTSNGIESRPPHDVVVFRKELLSRPDETFRCFAVVAEALRFAWLDPDDFCQAWREAQTWHASSFDNVPLVWCAALEKGTSDLLERSRAWPGRICAA